MRAASPDHRDQTPTCCPLRAPTHLSNPTFPVFHRDRCSSLGQDSPHRTRIWPMALRTRRPLPSWVATKCDRVVSLSAWPQPPRILSLRPLKHSSLRNPHQYLAIMVAHPSRTRTCSSRECNPDITRMASIPTSTRRVPPLRDLPPPRIRWASSR